MNKKLFSTRVGIEIKARQIFIPGTVFKSISLERIYTIPENVSFFWSNTGTLHSIQERNPTIWKDGEFAEIIRPSEKSSQKSIEEKLSLIQKYIDE